MINTEVGSWYNHIHAKTPNPTAPLIVVFFPPLEFASALISELKLHKECCSLFSLLLPFHMGFCIHWLYYYYYFLAYKITTHNESLLNLPNRQERAAGGTATQLEGREPLEADLTTQWATT